MVPVGSEQDSAAELTNVLLRASRWVDNICQQRYGLAASTNQDPPRRVRGTRDGIVLYWPLTFPIVSVVAGNWWQIYPSTAPTITPINTAFVTVLDKSIMIADVDYTSSRGWGAAPLMMQIEYQNGYAHTTLTNSPAAGATTITVASTIGMSGTAAGITTANATPYLTILDGNQREDIVVQSISGNTLTLTSGLQYPHAQGAIVTGIPYDVQQSTIDLAAYLIKTRDAGGIVMDERGFAGNESAKTLGGEMGLDETFKRLIPYTRFGGA